MKYSKQFEDDPDFTLEGRAINEWDLNELPRNLIPFAFDRSFKNVTTTYKKFSI